MDFIGFTYNGHHSVRDLKIYRTSNGSRYDENLTATMTDKVVDVPGGDGQYYFGTNFKNKTFNVQYAFDELDEAGLALLKKVFSGDGIHDLVFDEAPYKVWSAKVTGTAQIKHICFTDDNGGRVYKGEGSITFTCYCPYAHTPDLSVIEQGDYEPVNNCIDKIVDCDLFVLPNQKIKFWSSRTNARGVIWYSEESNGSWGETKEMEVSSDDYTSFENKIWIKQVKLTQKSIMQVRLSLTINNITYEYTKNACWETSSPEKKFGKDINYYPKYFFPNKMEWMAASGLEGGIFNGDNYGELPAPFVLTFSPHTDSDAIIEKDQEIKLTDNIKITIKEECKRLVWDSKTGIVTNGTHPIRYIGNSIAQLPVGKNDISLGAFYSLNYYCWYR